MKPYLFLVCLMSVLVMQGCAVNPTDVGRSQETSFEQQKRKQEELILRQKAVIERQQRELTDIKRQSAYDEQFRSLDPKE